MSITPNYILRKIKKELGKYGLKYEDNSDDVSRQSIMKPGRSKLLGLIQESKEVARITSISERKLEIIVFDKKEKENIISVAEEIKDRLEIEYKILKGY